MKHFKFYSKEDILSLTRVRRFETRLGERVQFLKAEEEWPELYFKKDEVERANLPLLKSRRNYRANA